MATSENVIGSVIMLVGRATAVSIDGTTRVLKFGDDIYASDVIHTDAGSRVDIAFDPTHHYQIAENQNVTIDSTIYGDGDPAATQLAVLAREAQGLNGGGIESAIASNGGSLDQLLESTAAGLGGGSGPEHSGRQTLFSLERVAEEVATGSNHATPEVSAYVALAEPGQAATVSAQAPLAVQSLSAATVQEGGNLVHTVALNHAANGATSLSFAIHAESAAEVGTPQFSNGVTLQDGQLLIPSGVSAFTITLPTMNDHVSSGNQTVALNVGGVNVVDTIIDSPSLALGAHPLAFQLADHAPATGHGGHASTSLHWHDVVSAPDALSHALGTSHAALPVAHLDLAAVLTPLAHGVHEAHHRAD